MTGPAAAWAVVSFCAGATRISFHIRSAAISPGMPARKNAWRQPNAVANATSSTGATNEPSRLEPKFCVTPIASPRRSGATSAAIIAWLIGMMPPSAAPISRRAPSRATNEPARPERKEHAEKASVARISSPLRLPVRSEMKPIPKAAHAQVSESALARIPTCVFVSPSSGCTNGIRKLSALRSKKTMPKLRLSSVTSMTWYAALFLSAVVCG